MRRRGKLLIWILAALLFFSLASCGSKAVSVAPKAVETSSAQSAPADTASAEAGGESAGAENAAKTDEADITGAGSAPEAASAGLPEIEKAGSPDDGGTAMAENAPSQEESASAASPKRHDPVPAAESDPAPTNEDAAAKEGEDSHVPSEDEDAEPEQGAPFVTITIQCRAVLEHPDELNEEKKALVPEDGVMLALSKIALEEGDTVYDILLRAAGAAGLALDEKNALGSVYIRGIGGLFEFDCGRGSGWMYKVNGVAPNYGCSKVTVSSGDEIEWYYVCS